MTLLSRNNETVNKTDAAGTLQMCRNLPAGRILRGAEIFGGRSRQRALREISISSLYTLDKTEFSWNGPLMVNNRVHVTSPMAGAETALAESHCNGVE